MTIEDVSISIIKYIDDILLSLETCVEMFGDSSTPSALVDKMQYIEQSVKEIDKTITVLQLNLKELHSRYAGLFKDLKYSAYMLLMILFSKGKESKYTLSSKEIMSLLGTCERTVDNAFSELKKKKYVEEVDYRFYEVHLR